MSSQKVINVEKVKYASLEKEMYLTYANGQKVLDTEIAKKSSLLCNRSQKVDDIKIIPSEVTTSFEGYIIKVFAKAWDIRYSSGSRLSITE